MVERPELAEALGQLIPYGMGPWVKLEWFAKPELALEALRRSGEPPDLLVTAFYFDGYFNNGLWLVREARKLYPGLLAVVTSGFPLEHLKGVAADWGVQPNLLLRKGEGDWFSALKELLSHSDCAGPVQSRIQRDRTSHEKEPSSMRGLEPQRRRPPRGREKPLVYFVGPPDSLNGLKLYTEEATPLRFKAGYDWHYFQDPELAWVSLSEGPDTPDGLVTDYYLTGGFTNGLKLVRHAKSVVPEIWTIMVTGLAEHHIRGNMEATCISPDMVFHCRGYGFLDGAFRASCGSGRQTGVAKRKINHRCGMVPPRGFTSKAPVA